MICLYDNSATHSLDHKMFVMKKAGVGARTAVLNNVLVNWRVPINWAVVRPSHRQLYRC